MRYLKRYIIPVFGLSAFTYIVAHKYEVYRILATILQVISHAVIYSK